MAVKQYALLLIAISLYGCDFGTTPSKEVTDNFYQEIKSNKGDRINISNLNGNIRILKNDKNSVEVYAVKKSYFGKKSLERVKISINSLSGKTSINTLELKEDSKVIVDYEIKVMDGVKVEDIENYNGKIMVRDISGDLLISNSNGDVTLKNIDGFVSVKTSNAEISITNTKGIYKAETSNGNIRADILNMTDRDLLIKTINGSVRLTMGEKINARLEMLSLEGDLYIHNVELRIEKLTKNHLKGKAGNGGNKISVETSNGDIDIYGINN